mmetsp:Transcript_20506/g.83161  ORF Transcript_20506/g.83161 Transcript_20506/m.83161 type:complete len:113 (+) Transcript_20506:2401-2739(+)
MAERLCAARYSLANRRILAESYLRCGKPVQAKSTLEDANDPESRYLYSVACVDLNLLREAEVALRPEKLKDYGSCNDVRGKEMNNRHKRIVAVLSFLSRKPLHPLSYIRSRS